MFVCMFLTRFHHKVGLLTIDMTFIKRLFATRTNYFYFPFSKIRSRLRESYVMEEKIDFFFADISVSSFLKLLKKNFFLIMPVCLFSYVQSSTDHFALLAHIYELWRKLSGWSKKCVSSFF